MLSVFLSAGLWRLVFPAAPAPGVLWSRDRSRAMDCVRVGAEEGSRSYPGQIAPTPPRGRMGTTDTVVCTERMLRRDLRSPQDEAVLTDLQATVSALASAARSQRPDLVGRTWLVEAHDPSTQVSAKLRFATQNALADNGLAVSDRTPVLAVGDVDVLTRLPPDQAYAVACERYGGNGSVTDDQVLMAIIRRDPRETSLHGGLCVDGQWTWLR